jgi:hypothetical protein
MMPALYAQGSDSLFADPSFEKLYQSVTNTQRVPSPSLMDIPTEPTLLAPVPAETIQTELMATATTTPNPIAEPLQQQLADGGMQTLVQGGLQILGDLQFIAILLISVCFFWGLGERKDGMEEGKRITQQKISQMESELKAVYTDSEAEQVDDLREKMVRNKNLV